MRNKHQFFDYLDLLSQNGLRFHLRQWQYSKNHYVEINVYYKGCIKIIIRNEQSYFYAGRVDISINRYKEGSLLVWFIHEVLTREQASKIPNLVIYALHKLKNALIKEVAYTSKLCHALQSGDILCMDIAPKFKETLDKPLEIRMLSRKKQTRLYLNGLSSVSVVCTSPPIADDYSRLYSIYCNMVINLVFSVIDVIFQLGFLNENYYPIHPCSMYYNKPIPA
jgi:hypothetical protein